MIVNASDCWSTPPHCPEQELRSAHLPRRPRSPSLRVADSRSYGGSRCAGVQSPRSGKRLEFARAFVPQLHRLAIIFNVGDAQPGLEVGETPAAARAAADDFQYLRFCLSRRAHVLRTQLHGTTNAANSCDQPSSARLPPTIRTEVPMRLIGLAVVLAF